MTCCSDLHTISGPALTGDWYFRLLRGAVFSVIFYLCAGSLLYPSSASAFDFQNGYRRSNALWITFKLNCSQKKATQEAYVGQLIYFGMLPMVDVSIFRCPNFFVGSFTSEVADINERLVYSHAPGRIFDILHYHYGKGRTTSEDYGHASRLHRSSDESIGRWFMGFDMAPRALYLWQGAFFKSFGPFDDGPVALADAPSHRDQIVVDLLNVLHSGNRKEATICALHYFAALRGWWGSAGFKRQSIGGDDDSIRRTSGENKSGVASGRTSKEQQEGPKYMGRNDTGARRFERTQAVKLLMTSATTILMSVTTARYGFTCSGQSVSPNLGVYGSESPAAQSELL